MYFEFELDDLAIEEPQGFADIIINLKRDDNTHGILIEASTSDLQFYGVAAAYLKSKKDAEGLKAEVIFRAYQSCGVYDDRELILEGRLNFGKYSASCGTSCVVTIPVEEAGCWLMLKSRYDQKVDLDSNVAFNKMTPLQNYAGLNFEMEIAAKELEAGIDGSVSEDGDTINLNVTSSLLGYKIYIRPTYSVERDNSIQTGQLTPVSAWQTTGLAIEDSAITPQLLYEDDIRCFAGSFPYSLRMKGVYTITGGGDLEQVNIKLFTWDGVGDIFTDPTLIDSVNLFTGSSAFPVNTSFDGSLSGNIILTEGLGLYAIIEFVVSSPALVSSDYNIMFDEDTFFTLTASKICPPTEANVYLVNETLSRATEAITDGCLRVKSDYYGRTDSEPYASGEDGCGALRVLTSGLKIRRADNAKFFESLKGLFEGLKGIDNIGMGIETNPMLPNSQWLRIEPVEYFYQDTELLSLPNAPQAVAAIQEQSHYSLIKSGYKKWEVENINGLNEFNSNREYRTSLTTVNNTLDITSALIAGGYPWEITRQQSFAETGKADTKFDNDTFIACVERDAYGFQIEQGNIEDAENIFSPSTAYNWRIRPFYNLMRWFKSIANSYPNLVDTTNKLFFSSGTGNFIASGEIAGAYPACKLENSEKAENKDLSITDFVNQTDAVPLWKPEYMTFKYPLSVKEYRQLRANPYGYIAVSCGNNNDFIKGYIQEIRYSLIDGSADFTLKLKYE